MSQKPFSPPSHPKPLSTADLVIFGAVLMVPIAPMSMYVYIAEQSGGHSWLVMLLGWFGACLTAYAYRRLAGVFPGGSIYSYVGRALQSDTGWIAAWIILADYLFVPATLYANCSSLIGEYLPQIPSWSWYAVLSLINLALGLLPIRRQIRLYALVLIGELIALIAFIVVALHALPHAGLPAGSPVHVGPERMLSLVSVGVIGFLGFDAISTLDGEAARPTKSVGRATIWVAAVMGLLFLLQCALAGAIHPNYATLDPATGFFDLARSIGGPFVGWLLITVFLIGSGIANASAGQVSASRVLAVLREQTVPTLSAKSRHLDRVTMILISLLSFVVATFVPLQTLNAFVSFGAFAAFIMIHVSLFYRFYVRGTKGPKRIVDGLVAILGLLVMIVALIFEESPSLVLKLGALWLLVGVAIWAIRTWREAEV
ncbi:amino acid permease-associated region [Alicyclobacillus hesperidum URH17-3-68]|uniref:APC family permease n=1 Tax=Alicyclobacillus hesperidum TaxID=89784 RepID=UPI000281BB0B|nr:APC family permease [Alicyclobacillus hesperidum]EJY57153.1 amino acid permease-associated region [Alicyclobacillus hesperidum URH17-3-68]